LQDRMEVIELPGYIEEEKLAIARQFLVARQLSEHGLTSEHLRFTDGALRRMIREYTREAGVRNLEREIANICRKVARKVADTKPAPLPPAAATVEAPSSTPVEASAPAVPVASTVAPDTAASAPAESFNEQKEGLQGEPTVVTASTIPRFLGPRQFSSGVAEEQDEVGVATGLTWSPVGGDITPVEVTLLEGKGNLILTGQLGETMRESAQAAWSYTRSRAEALKLPEQFHDKTDVHIHVPSGGVPKDGPSAGITMATALVSAATHRPARKDVAMTGEITLRGRVLPIGGLKEKVLAAHRAGIRTLILPAKNRKDLLEVPAAVQRHMEFVFVDHMDAVLPVALHEA